MNRFWTFQLAMQTELSSEAGTCSLHETLHDARAIRIKTDIMIFLAFFIHTYTKKVQEIFQIMRKKYDFFVLPDLLQLASALNDPADQAVLLGL